MTDRGDARSRASLSGHVAPRPLYLSSKYSRLACNLPIGFAVEIFKRGEGSIR